MKARPLIPRIICEVEYEDGLGLERYYALTSGHIMPNHTLVTEGEIQKGDYVKMNHQNRPNKVIWMKAVGLIGMPIGGYVVCRPI